MVARNQDVDLFVARKTGSYKGCHDVRTGLSEIRDHSKQSAVYLVAYMYKLSYRHSDIFIPVTVD
jgi:hypothetical protein